jgi:hypothetical protein
VHLCTDQIFEGNGHDDLARSKKDNGMRRATQRERREQDKDKQQSKV